MLLGFQRLMQPLGVTAAFGIMRPVNSSMMTIFVVT